MNTEADRYMEECVDDLRMAVRALIRQRQDWAALPEAAREKLRADMDRSDRLILGSSVERVISGVAMFVRIEIAKSKEEATA